MTTWRWCDSPKRIAAESGLELEKFEMVPTSPTASCRDAGNGVFSYRDNGLAVLVDWYNRRILRAGLDLSAETLDGWYFNTRALQQCRKLKITPGNVVASLEDSDAFPAKNGHTLYRGTFDVLVHEGRGRVVSVGEVNTLSSSILRQAVPRGSGGTPVGSMPQDVNDLLKRARRAGLAVSKSGAGHYKIWESETPGAGRSVVIPSTGSDRRGMKNNIMEIRSAFGIDLRRL